MAGFRMHITVSSICGVGYGVAAVQPLGFDFDAALLAGGVTAVGGMVPDLDSDSGVPVREMFGLAAVMIPLMLVHRVRHAGLSPESLMVMLLFGYIFIKYFAPSTFKRF